MFDVWLYLFILRAFVISFSVHFMPFIYKYSRANSDSNDNFERIIHHGASFH